MTKCNIANRALFIRDNLDILININSETVDLIYLDPPFNSNKHYAAPSGSRAAGAAFKDAWTLDDLDHAWVGQIAESHPKLSTLISAVGVSGDKGDMAYLTFMARRLLELRRILKPTGSLYLHCDPTMSHSLKLMTDCIFGKRNFRNEIIWHYSNASRGKKRLAKSHDVILWYNKTAEAAFYREEILAPYQSKMTEWRHKKAGKEPPKGKTPDDVFSLPSLNTMASERVGWPTQKPLALLEFLIKAGSKENDIILDPFCGCATTLVAAELHNRRWLGIDISSGAKDAIKRRLEASQDLLTTKGVWKKVEIRTVLPIRTDKGESVVNPKIYKHALYGWQKNKCAGCRLEFPFRNMEIDHIYPRSKGGGDTKDNLQLICGACNRVKGDRTMDYLLAELRKHGLVK